MSTKEKHGNDHVTFRKKKRGEDFSEMFKEFSENIMSSLETWKVDFGKEITQINNSLDHIIKNDLTTLKETSLELKTEINSMRKEYTEVKTSVNKLNTRQNQFEKEMLTLQKSIQFNSSQYDDLIKETSAFSEEVKK